MALMFVSRLDKLLALRRQVDVEIAEERARIARNVQHHKAIDAAHVSVLAKTRRRDPASVRAWARASGFEIGDRGRVPVAIYEAFDKAHALGSAPVGIAN